MKLSEKHSYLLAVIIVVLGTLAIAAGFMVGLLSLTGTDSQPAGDGESVLSSDLRAETADGILSGDYIISGDLVSSDYLFSRDATEISEKTDEFTEIPRDIIRRQALTSADQYVRRGRWLFIDKGNFTLTLYDKDTALKKWKIAVGIVPGDKQRVGDNRTPNGVFTISRIHDSSSWTHDFGDGNGVIQDAYGPWFIRLYTPPWTGIGIHGTHDPHSINSRASEGCIRMSNDDISELKTLVKIEMPVVIVE